MAALTRDELIALWQSSVDPDFARALLEQPDSGVEVIEASAEVMAKVSETVERTSQSLFLKTWSGQTYPPARGVGFAGVVLDISRAAPADEPVVLEPGIFFVEQSAIDHGEDHGEVVGTERRYTPVAPVVFVPGVSLVSATFIAEKAGAAYNLPPPDSINLIKDSGTASGTSAAVFPGVLQHQLVLSFQGDTVAPSALGQYVRMSAGANLGQRRRIVGYQAPDPNAPHNGILTLAATMVLTVSSVTGTFIPGERIEQAATGAALELTAQQGIYMVGDRLTPPVFNASAVVGIQSGATATVGLVLIAPDMTAETVTAGWDLLTWAEGVGLSSTNPLSPDGGSSPTLDHVGEERGINRSPNEPDEQYRKRIYNRPDVVSPNALVRAMNRVLAPYGLTGCLREPSDLDTFPGLFYDAPAAGLPSRRYAYDMDFTLRPDDRYKLALDLAEFRGFFVATIPPMSLGEFGCAFDEGFVCFFDSAPYFTFFDGYAVTAAAIRQAVWNALNEAREAGVGFVLVEDRFGC